MIYGPRRLQARLESPVSTSTKLPYCHNYQNYKFFNNAIKNKAWIHARIPIYQVLVNRVKIVMYIYMRVTSVGANAWLPYGF